MIFDTIKAIYDASQAGQQLENPAVWANRANSTQLVGAVLAAGLVLVNQYTSMNLGLSHDEINTIATTVAIVGGMVCSRLHIAANKDAGRVVRPKA